MIKMPSESLTKTSDGISQIGDHKSHQFNLGLYQISRYVTLEI
ncbi:Uncharacterised protein [Neisseria gonorrhoeae]|uniref:Uncharacterized protein n=1 Tax=Neisseria gonorrhoeae TaxID=485 RepID=A0A378VUK2_NEIGO|nr:Uncharacterised protein [Neisseria gonorrhoeae]